MTFEEQMKKWADLAGVTPHMSANSDRTSNVLQTGKALSLLQPGKLVPFTFGASVAGWHNIAPFTRCPKEFQFARVRKIRPRGTSVAEPLSVGLLLHVARAQWLNDLYKGDLWREAVEKYVEVHDAQQKLKLFPDAKHIAIRTFEAYVEFWNLRPKNKVLAVEYEIKPRALIPGAPAWTHRGARLDSIEVQDGKAWIGELKSTWDGPFSVTDIYRLNGQTMLQACLWSGEEEDKFGPLGGILLDVARKANGKQPGKAYPRVKLTLDSLQNGMKWFRRDFSLWVMQSSAIEWNSTVERRPVCKRADHACDFIDLCLMGRDGSLQYVLEDGTSLHKWTPTEGKTTPPWE